MKGGQTRKAFEALRPGRECHPGDLVLVRAQMLRHRTRYAQGRVRCATHAAPFAPLRVTAVASRAEGVPDRIVRAWCRDVQRTRHSAAWPATRNGSALGT